MQYARTAAVVALAALTAAAYGQEPQREDLSQLRLIHGTILLPTPAAPEAAKEGYIAHLATGKWTTLPTKNANETVLDLLQRMRRNAIGDIFYSAAGNGSFLVISGKARDLGEGYLQDFAGKKLAEPGPTVDANTPGQVPGTVTDVKAGHVYLVQTCEGRFALLRVIQKEKDAAHVQFVYQADGSTLFPIPKANLVAYEAARVRPAEGVATTTLSAVPEVAPVPGVAAPVVPEVPSITVTGTGKGTLYTAESGVPEIGQSPRESIVLEPFLETHLEQQQALVARRVATVRKPASTDREVIAKALAMEDLGRMRAVDAVDALVAEITFYNTQAKPRKFAPEAFHPAVGALKAIGKPGSTAALKAIGAVKPTDAGVEATKSGEYRVHLLTMVVAEVEGKDVAEFLLTRERNKAAGEARGMYELALKLLAER